MKTKQLECGCEEVHFRDGASAIQEVNCENHRKEHNKVEKQAQKFAEENPSIKDLTVRGR